MERCSSRRSSRRQTALRIPSLVGVVHSQWIFSLPMMVINTPCCSNQTHSQPKNSEPIQLALKSSHENLLNTQVRHNFPHVASDCASLRFGRIRSTDSHPSRRIRPTDWHPASPVTLHPSGPPSVEPPRRCSSVERLRRRLVRRTPSSASRPSNAFVGASSVERLRRRLVRRAPSSSCWSVIARRWPPNRANPSVRPSAVAVVRPSTAPAASATVVRRSLVYRGSACLYPSRRVDSLTPRTVGLVGRPSQPSALARRAGLSVRCRPCILGFCGRVDA